MKILPFIILAATVSSCKKEPYAVPQSKTKTDTVKTIVLANANLPNYDWYNGSSGIGEVIVNCKDCTGLIKEKAYWPFTWDPNGYGKLRYDPIAGDTLRVSICPKGTQIINVIIYGKDKTVPLMNRTDTISTPKSYEHIF